MKAKFQSAKIRECLKKPGSQATIISRENRSVIASRCHPYILSNEYADKKVYKTLFQARNNIPHKTNITIAIQDNVIGTNFKETYI
jgi:hypothetical protein